MCLFIDVLINIVFGWRSLIVVFDFLQLTCEFSPSHTSPLRPVSRYTTISDNIDMSKVNKTMFGAGLRNDGVGAILDGKNDEDDADLGVGRNDLDENNDGGFRFDINQATLERLTKAGLAREVVRQSDGSEYELDMAGGASSASGETGERTAFSMLGRDVSYDELIEAGMVGGGIGTTRSKSLVVGADLENIDDGMIANPDVIDSNDFRVVEMPRAEAGGAPENANGSDVVVDSDDGDDVSTKPRDPIDILTVARLKEVLRAQGLKSTGTKQALRDRLRDHVKSLLRE